jgi:hypothetical protein
MTADNLKRHCMDLELLSQGGDNRDINGMDLYHEIRIFLSDSWFVTHYTNSVPAVVAQDSWLISEFGHRNKDHADDANQYYNGRKKLIRFKNY